MKNVIPRPEGDGVFERKKRLQRLGCPRIQKSLGKEGARRLLAIQKNAQIVEDLR